MDYREKYPWLYPPPGFHRIDRNNIAVISNPGVVNVTQVLETISEVGQGMEGWIRCMALVSGDFNLSFFTILENDQPMKDYVSLQAQIGDTPTPREAFILLKGNNTYKLQVTALPGALNIALRWTLFGWYYPTRGNRR